MVTKYIASTLEEIDAVRFKCKIGDCEGQQVWECLAAQVAFRAWKEVFVQYRVCLHMTSDNVTALQMINTLRGTTPQINMIARELAIDFGDSAFRPRIVIHKPGVTNVTCDALSRLTAPADKKKEKPKWLVNIEETKVPLRTDDYFLALMPPEI